MNATRKASHILTLPCSRSRHDSARVLLADDEVALHLDLAQALVLQVIQLRESDDTEQTLTMKPNKRNTYETYFCLISS